MQKKNSEHHRRLAGRRSDPLRLVALILALIMANPPMLIAQSSRGKMARSGPRLGEFSTSGARVDSSSKLEASSTRTNDPLRRSESERKIEASVAGYIKLPGTYRLFPTARVTDLLKAAGEILPQASRRRIELRRGKKKPIIVDLVAFANRGDLDNNPYLRNGDLVFVPASMGAIKVVGAVRRPGNQELLGPKTLRDAVLEADGYATDFDESAPVRVVRIVSGSRKVLEFAYDYRGPESNLISGDLVIVPSIAVDEKGIDYRMEQIPGVEVYLPPVEDKVYMVGGFTFPGPYAYKAELTLDRYVALAGGFSIMAKRDKMYVRRSNGTRVPVGPEQPLPMQPGDTVVTPEKDIPPQFWPSFFLSLASFALTAFLAVDSIRQ